MTKQTPLDLRRFTELEFRVLDYVAKHGRFYVKLDTLREARNLRDRYYRMIKSLIAYAPESEHCKIASSMSIHMNKDQASLEFTDRRVSNTNVLLTGWLAKRPEEETTDPERMVEIEMARILAQQEKGDGSEDGKGED